MPALASGHRR